MALLGASGIAKRGASTMKGRTIAYRLAWLATLAVAVGASWRS
jgi:hypothetical protein